MAGHDHRGAPEIEFFQEQEQIPGGVLIQIGGQLVEKENLRIVDDGPGQLHPAALPHGQLRRITVQHVAHAHKAQCLAQPGRSLGIPSGTQCRYRQQVFSHSPFADQRGELGNVSVCQAHPVLPPGREGGHIDAVVIHAAPGGLEVAGEQLQQCGFPGAAAAGDKNELSLFNGQVKVLHGMKHLLVRFQQVIFVYMIQT